MKPKAKTYKFKLYEEDLSNSHLIEEIKKAILTLPVAFFSFVIVDLFNIDSKAGIPFFQTTRHRSFQKTDFYSFEIRVDSKSTDKLQWTVYKKNLQTKEQVLNAFEDICIRRIIPDLSEWEISKTDWSKPNNKRTNIKLAKRLISDYYNTESPTPTDDIKYLESIRYLIDNNDNYTGNESIALAERYEKYGQYEKAQEIYQLITHVPDATYNSANLIMFGKLGKPDYKRAYQYYQHNCLIDDINYFGSKIKIAKMHKYGQYFKLNYSIYERMMRSIEKEYSHNGGIYPCLPELFYELSLIEYQNKNIERATEYCLKASYWAKEFLSFGDDEEFLITANRIFKLLQTLMKPDDHDADIYELLLTLETQIKIIFVYDNTTYEIEGLIENKRLVIRFEDKFYSDTTNFLRKARLNGKPILYRADEITIVEVLK